MSVANFAANQLWFAKMSRSKKSASVKTPTVIAGTAAHVVEMTFNAPKPYSSAGDGGLWFAPIFFNKMLR